MNVAGNPALETHPVQANSSASPSARLVLSLLGPPQVLVNGQVVIGPQSQKVLALLAYLAVEAHRPHLRSALAALFWPDQTEKQAHQNLRKTLSRLRRVIADRPAIRNRTRSGDRARSRDREADPPHLITESQTIQFNLQSDCWLDVTAFRSLLGNTQRHSHRRLDACSICVSQLAQACELYRGDFLAGLYVPDSFAFDEWLLIEREQLGQQACAALQALASSHLARGEPGSARRYAQWLLRLDPWNEAAQRVLLRALALSDGRNAALQHYRVFRQALAEELDLEPEDETLALVEQIRADALADVQPRAPTALLPTPSTLFVGREAEREQISDYLAGQDQRLITLYGPGGMGKTRLALEIAAEQAPLWQDGVWFVPLAGVPAPEGLVDALATTLHLGARDGPLEPAQLIDLLRSKELLLILDSFEHLASDTSLLQDILRWAPEVRILVTSRARLGLRGEWATLLQGLDVPAETPATEAAKDHSAVQLFLQSARRVNPEFVPTPENLPRVVGICRLLDGLPLGIQLAAAWVRLFPCRQIADEIERSLDFLHTSQPDAPERQRSLRATFEYSYNLLSETEQALFRKLSVFRGGFMADVARQVAGASPSDLASLLDKSLLQTSPSGRLNVHLTLRQYAAEKLAQWPQEEQETRERHSCTYLAFVQQKAAALTGANSKEAMAEIYVELGNVRQAWRCAVAQTNVAAIDTSMEGLARFYNLVSFLQEGVTVFGSAAERVLALAQANREAQRVAGRLLAEQSNFLTKQGLYERAIQVAQTAIDQASASEDTYGEAAGYFQWGTALRRRGDYEPAEPLLRQALVLVRSACDPRSVQTRRLEANILRALGAALWGQSDYTGAQAFLEQALHVDRAIGDRRGEGWTHNNLGLVAENAGDCGEAIRYYEQGLRIFRETGDRWGESIALGNLGYVYARVGNYTQARVHYQQDLAICREVNDRRGEGWTSRHLSLVACHQSHHGEALEYTRRALSIHQSLDNSRGQAESLTYMGHALTGLSRLEEAARAYRRALELWHASERPGRATEALAGLARVSLAQGDPPQAQTYAEEVLSYLEAHALPRINDTFWVYLTCYQALRANRDSRAPDVLANAYHLLQDQAARITDEKVRRSFLENVTAHREILNEFANGG